MRNKITKIPLKDGKAPYGYCKSAGNKHKLVVDDYAADVVRRIISLRESGMSTYKITAMLNQEGILPPLAYWYQQNGKEGCKASSVWTSVVVMGILRNEVYLGNLVMNYTGSRSYKDNTMVRKPMSEWVRCEGTHEAIISHTLWDAVQEINVAATQTEFGKNANHVDAYDYDKAFGTYHTSQQMAEFLLRLYDSDCTVGIVDRETFQFELRSPMFPYANTSTHNQNPD